MLVILMMVCVRTMLAKYNIQIMYIQIKENRKINKVLTHNCNIKHF